MLKGENKGKADALMCCGKGKTFIFLRGRDNQAVMITPFKTNFNHFQMNLVQRKIFFLDWRMGKNGCLSCTHTDPKVVLTDCESFRSENLKRTKQIRNQPALRILPVFTKLKSKAYSRSYSEKHRMSPLSLCLNEFGRTCSGRQTHTRTLESSSFPLTQSFQGCLI